MSSKILYKAIVALYACILVFVGAYISNMAKVFIFYPFAHARNFDPVIWKSLAEEEKPDFFEQISMLKDLDNRQLLKGLGVNDAEAIIGFPPNRIRQASHYYPYLSSATTYAFGCFGVELKVKNNTVISHRTITFLFGS